MLLCSLGHVASTGDLLRHGLTRRDVARLASGADVVKVRRGILACSHLDRLERFAVVSGARIDCVSVLRERGVWVGQETREHFELDRRSQLPAATPDSVRWHWRNALGADPLRVPVIHALQHAMRCLPPDDVVATLESALHTKAITRREFDRLIVGAPYRLRAVLAEAEPGAQAGPETHVRLRLRRAGYRVVPQAFVPGVGHVDNLVEDVLALETDGRAYHAETFEEDRRRDLAAEWIGVRSLRIPAGYVFSRWDWVSETVARMVRDGLELRRIR
jgi:very-short-patch-repair endonuclease